jgi:hypothetical protein
VNDNITHETLAGDIAYLLREDGVAGAEFSGGSSQESFLTVPVRDRTFIVTVRESVEDPTYDDEDEDW